jgi:4-hydroxy-tetrahydrodipicolinate reductase
MEIIIHGFGRLGRAIAQLASDMRATVVATVDKDAPLDDCTAPANVIIDSSHADAVSGVVKYAVLRKIPLVICTTGLSDDTLNEIAAAAELVPILLSSNMSLGVNLQSKLAAIATQTLAKSGFDIEIIEAHHNQKLDAPSGTAFLLANSINAAADGKFKFVYDRSQYLQKREADEIGISAIRGGTIVGEHSVIFAGPDEIVEITHRALSREIFARGALRAAKFIADKPAKLYTINDLLGVS